MPGASSAVIRSLRLQMKTKTKPKQKSELKSKVTPLKALSSVGELQERAKIELKRDQAAHAAGVTYPNAYAEGARDALAWVLGELEDELEFS